MKKTLVIAAAMISLVACNKEGGATASGFKTAYVDTSKLIEKSDELKDLEDKAKVKEQEMGRELQTDAEQLRLEAAAAEGEARTKGMEWAQLKGQQLQKRQQELSVKQQTFQEEFAKEFGVKRDTVVSQIKKVIKEYGKKKGYDYIYGTGDAASVLYAKEGYDVTDEILKEINDKYKSTKGSTEPAKAEPAKEEKK
ncbi:OmpH family outer membrane protein [Flavobacterium sp. RHBU_3]|uniref:OmpH family outer membrane protein n=1 Tax=Flavobacterium sp. RHBU_3 TaxID=3391184 RepID=UPI0039853965